MGRNLVWPAILAFASLLVTASNCVSTPVEDEPLVIAQSGKYGFIDHTGRVIIQPQFIWGFDFWRGLGTVYVCGRYASIDIAGRLSPRRIAVEGQLVGRKNGEKYGFVDGVGQFKIAPAFDDILDFSEGLAAVEVDEKWGFVDTEGRQVIPPMFSAAYYFREGVAVVGADSGDALIDKSGQVLASGYTFTDLVADGRVPVSNGRTSGFLDLSGRVAIPLVFEEARRFSGGLAEVEKAGKWGYVDRQGQIVIPFKFDEAGPFASGLAPARIGNNSGFIDKTGNFAFTLSYKYSPGFFAGDHDSGLFIADSDVSAFWTDDGKFGYVNTSGHVIWGPAEELNLERIGGDWSDREKKESCEGLTEDVKAKVSALPVE